MNRSNKLEFYITFGWKDLPVAMEQHALKNVNKCLNTNIYSYLETSGGQSFNLNLNVVNFFYTSVNLTSAAAKDSYST
jgi:hypothetical protein